MDHIYLCFLQCYTVLYTFKQCSTILCSVTQCYTVLQSFKQCHTVLYSVTQFYKVLSKLLQWRTVSFSVKKFYTVLHSLIHIIREKLMIFYAKICWIIYCFLEGGYIETLRENKTFSVLFTLFLTERGLMIDRINDGLFA